METLVVKPRFRFMGREGGRYYWEPLNDEARALMMTPVGSTSVRWFWGDRGATARELEAAMTPLTAEEWAELIPPGSWPAGMTRLAADVFPDGRRPSAGGVLPSPVPATSAVKLSAGCYYVPASAVRRYGRRFLDALNGGRA